MEQIGLEMVLKDADFQRGLAQAIVAMNRVQNTTQQAASTVTSSFSQMSTGAIAFGNVIGNLVTQAINKFTGAIASIPQSIINTLNITRKWSDSLDDMMNALGMSAQSASIFNTALQRFGMGETGASSFRYLIQQINTTKSQYSDAAETFKIKSGELGEQLAQINADTAEQIAAVWQDLAEKRAGIEADLADKISGYQEDLNTKLQDIAAQRQQNEIDFAKSIARLESDTQDRLRNGSNARERRLIKKQAAQAKQDLIDKYNEQQAQLAKQEAREKAAADRQIQLAEKVAATQIKAAEEAANKQVAAFEKAAEKQAQAIAKSLEDAKKALSDAQVRSPLSQALDKLGLSLKDISDESVPFEKRIGKIMDAFKKMPDGVNKTAIAIQLFGRAGIGWLDFLNYGSAGLEEMRKRAEALGITFTEQDVAAFKQFGFSLNLLGQDFDAISINIGKHLLPIAQEFLTRLDAFLVENMPKFTAMLDRLAAAFSQNGIQGLFDQLSIEINNAFPAVKTAFENIMAQISSVMNIVFKGVQMWYDNGGRQTLEIWGTNIATALINGFTNALGNLSDSINAAIYQAFGMSPEEALWYARGNLFGTYQPNRPRMHQAQGFASGGWVPYDMLAQVHKGEYVLNKQQAMQFAPALAGANNSRTMNFYNTWSPSISNVDRASLDRGMRDIVHEEITNVLGA